MKKRRNEIFEMLFYSESDHIITPNNVLNQTKMSMSIVIPFKDQPAIGNTLYFEFRFDSDRKHIFSRNLQVNTKVALSEFCPVLGLPKSASKDRIIAELNYRLVFEKQETQEEPQEEKEPAPLLNIAEESTKAPKFILRISCDGIREIQMDKPQLFVLKQHKFVGDEYKEFRMGEYLTEKEAVASALRKMSGSGMLTTGPEWVHMEDASQSKSGIATHMLKYIYSIAQLKEYLNYTVKERANNQPDSWHFSCNGNVV